MVSWYLRKFGEFLLAVSREPTEASVTRTTRRQRKARRKEFNERARRVIATRLSSSTKLVAGSVQLVGMNAIKAALGDDWLAVADQAYAIAEATIRAHMHEADAFDRRDDDTYILCFAACDKRDAARRTARIVEDIRRRLEERVPQATALRVEHDVAELEWKEIDGDDTPLIDLLAQQLRHVRTEAEQSARQWKRTLIRDATVVYAPVWNVKARNVTMFRCLLGDAVGRNVVGRIQALSSTEEMLQTISELDLVIVSRAIQALHAIMQAGRSTELIVPLTFHTVAEKRQRTSFLALCRDIPEAYRSSIHFELHSIPASVPVPRVIEAVQQLKPLAKSVILQTPMDEQRLREMTGTGLYGAAFDASWFAQRSINMELYLARYVRYARAVNLSVLVYGVNTVGLAQAAVDAEVDHVTGEAVAHPLDVPKSAYSLTVGEVWTGRGSYRRTAGAR
jgi:hypothetical protein